MVSGYFIYPSTLILFLWSPSPRGHWTGSIVSDNPCSCLGDETRTLRYWLTMFPCLPLFSQSLYFLYLVVELLLVLSVSSFSSSFSGSILCPDSLWLLRRGPWTGCRRVPTSLFPPSRSGARSQVYPWAETSLPKVPNRTLPTIVWPNDDNVLSPFVQV